MADWARLIEDLHAPDEETRIAAADGIGQYHVLIDDPQAVKLVQGAVPDLIDALQDESPLVRRSAAYALGSIEDRRAIPAMAACLVREVDDQGLQLVIIKALGKIRDPQALGILRQHEQHESLCIRTASSRAAARIEESLAGHLRMQHQRSEAGQQARAILDREPDAVAGLLGTHPDSTVRGLAADALRRSGDTRHIPALMRALRDEPAVAGHAVQALCTLGEQYLLPLEPIAALMIDERDPWLRVAAAEAAAQLARSKPEVAAAIVPRILRALMMVEKEAAYTLTMDALIGIGPNAAGPLITALDDPDGHVARQAAYVLGQIDQTHPTPRITEALARWNASQQR